MRYKEPQGSADGLLLRLKLLLDMDRNKKESVRTQITWVAAVIAFVTGISLSIAGFVVPPTGIISGSVLTIVGEFLAFFSAIMGISSYTAIEMERIKRSKPSDGDSEEVE